jgi:hypothetical protein
MPEEMMNTSMLMPREMRADARRVATIRGIPLNRAGALGLLWFMKAKPEEVEDMKQQFEKEYGVEL